MRIITFVLPFLLILPVSANPKNCRGCDPRTSPDGCASCGAPIALNKQEVKYLIVATNHKAVGLKGWCDRDIRVGDLTSMRPQTERSDEFPIPVTYQKSW